MNSNLKACGADKTAKKILGAINKETLKTVWWVKNGANSGVEAQP